MKQFFSIPLLIIILITTTIPVNGVALSTLDDYFENYHTEQEFNGSITVSKLNDNGYDILYQGGVGSQNDVAFDENSIYDIGSVTKLFTTTAILQLRDLGLITLDDTLDMFFDNVPDDKKMITIEQLLTHTSGVFVEENEDTSVSKEDEINRILTSPLTFVPGENYNYSNAGFTLLAAIIEDVTNSTYEDYIRQNIFEPYHLESTHFITDTDIDTSKTVSGSMDGYSYGYVDKQPYGWYSRGYTDILSTSTDLTRFFYETIFSTTLSTESKQQLSSKYIDLGSGDYRGVGTSIIQAGTDTYIGHNGVWNTGNTSLYYRESDQVLISVLSNEVFLYSTHPAQELLTDFYTTFSAFTLDLYPIIETVDLSSSNKETSEVEAPTSEKEQSSVRDIYFNFIVENYLQKPLNLFASLLIPTILVILVVRINSKRKK